LNKKSEYFEKIKVRKEFFWKKVKKGFAESFSKKSRKNFTEN
jgi:hypothetical protein